MALECRRVVARIEVVEGDLVLGPGSSEVHLDGERRSTGFARAGASVLALGRRGRAQPDVDEIREAALRPEGHAVVAGGVVTQISSAVVVEIGAYPRAPTAKAVAVRMDGVATAG